MRHSLRSATFYFIMLGLMIVATCIGIEGICGLFYSYESGTLFWTRERASLSARPQPPEREQDAGWLRLSPYFGQVMRPGYRNPSSWEELGRNSIGYTSRPYYADWTVNNYGFFSDRNYPVSVDPDDLVVGIFGGSVAFYLAMDGRDWIIDALRSVPGIATRRIVILNFSNAGYKQPQQSLVLNYFVAAGQHFDVIINLDGLNEVYTGFLNSGESGSDSLMPPASLILALQNALASSEEAYQVAVAKHARLDFEWRMAATRFAFRHYLFRHMRDRSAANELAELRQLGRTRQNRQYVITMPSDRSSFGERIPAIVRAWMMGSLQMDSIAKRIGAHYLHILQPNQYFGPRGFLEGDSGQIPKTPSPFPPSIVAETYPEFVRGGQRLRERGVNFVDATAIFDAHREPIYYDNCCHFNLRGYEVLVRSALTPALRNLAFESRAR